CDREHERCLVDSRGGRTWCRRVRPRAEAADGLCVAHERCIVRPNAEPFDSRLTPVIPSTPAMSATVAVPVARDAAEIERATMRQVSLRFFPLLFALFVSNYVDRTNLAMAKLQMNHDLGMSNTAYGLGASLFFVGYCLLEVPSNIILARV